LLAVSDTEDDDVLEHVHEETTVDWCETLNKVLYEWQVDYWQRSTKQNHT